MIIENKAPQPRNHRDLEEFLRTQNINYCENRNLFHAEIEKILESGQDGIHIIWNCKIREWSNVLSINGSIAAEQYYAELTRRLSHVIRSQQTPWICRSASDEIILFCRLELTEDVTIEMVSNQLIECTSYAYRIGNDYIQNRLTIGISHSKIDVVKNADDLIAEAKIAMDQLTFSHYNSAYLAAIDSGDQKRFKLEEKNKEAVIKTALADKQFLPYYQAIANTLTGEIVGFECLARLEEQSQILAPDYFLPLIKSQQLTADLDLAICEKVIASIGIIHAKSPYSDLTFNVNVSGDLIRSPEKLSDFLALIATAQLPSNKKLQIEIVEDSFEVEDHVLEDFFSCLKQMEVNVYIDDFGLGFSSVDRLLTLPVYGVKLDSIFVSGMSQYDDRKKNFLGAIIKALSGSGLEIVAESIENDFQLDWIKELNVQKYQGYAISKPINLRDTIELILTRGAKPKAISPKNRSTPVNSLGFRHSLKKLLRKIFFTERRGNF